MQQVTEKKLSRKKTLSQESNIPPQVQAKIDEEYNASYEKHLKEIKARLGDDFKGMYARWFDSDMAMMYEMIRKKHLEEYNKSKEVAEKKPYQEMEVGKE